MSKTHGVTIHRVFQVYQDIFDHLEMPISKLERKRMQWEVDIREGLVKAKLKAASYYGKTESSLGSSVRHWNLPKSLLQTQPFSRMGS